MEWQDRLDQYKAYQAKLRLLELMERTRGLFRVSVGLEKISMDLLKFANFQEYPEILHIPSFVNELQHIREKDRDKPNKRLKEIKKLHIPDSFNMTNEAFAQLASFKKILPGLEIISITTSQFKLCSKIGCKFELRMPQEAYMKPTEAINKLLDYITPRHLPTNPSATGTTLFGLFEIISRAANEETVLAGISVYAMDNNLCDLEEIQLYLPEEIYQSVKALNNSTGDVNKAQIIRSYYWFTQYYDIKSKLGYNFDLPCQHFLNYCINTTDKLPFDIGQKFMANLQIEDGIMQGFKGNGGLGYFKYIIRGEISSSLALDVIRLTSTTEYVTNEDQNKKLGLGCTGIDLSFFKQHWYTLYGNGKNFVWSYPDGTIQASGYRFGYSIEQIVAEACILAAQFKGLSMNILIVAEEAENETTGRSNEKESINIEIGNGNVRVTDMAQTDYSGGSIRSYGSCKYIKRINDLLAENKMPLSGDELQEIYARNEFDRASDDAQRLRELFRLICSYDAVIVMHLDVYLREIKGISLPLHHGIRNPAYLYLRFLYDYDTDKLKKFIKSTRRTKSNNLGLLSESESIK